ncbi:hypothetical protein BSKO_11188 [Bryopsis sp. KO-2023]|nr:hypothetical protein BSKO_11188 [Bryopsis sp. KO-2023]
MVQMRIFVRWVVAFLFCLGNTLAANCPDDIVRVVGRADGKPKVVYGRQAAFGGALDHVRRRKAVEAITPLDGCSELDPKAVGGAVVLAVRGNCSFLEKALAVQRAGGVGLLVYNNVTEEGPMCMAGGGNDPLVDTVTIPAVALSWDDGQTIADVGSSGGSVTISATAKHPLISCGLMWLIAVGTVTLASLWSGRDHSASRSALLNRSSGRSSGGESDTGGQAVVISEKTAVAFVVGASAMLLFLFLVLNKVVFYVLLGFFVVAATQSVAVLVAHVLAKFNSWFKNTTINIWGLGELNAAQAIAVPVALAVCITWAVTRNSHWSWILQDAIGVSLLVLALRLIRIPTLKVAAIMLPLFLLYDVFWVFIQPMISKHEKSVMVEVATAKGIDEFMPMVFRVPSIWDSGLGEYSILGYGDVLMPGLLVAYTRRLDLSMNRVGWRGYFPATVISYGVGLLLTYGAQYLKVGGGRGQPALLYLVPCTLGTVMVLSMMRSEFCLLMTHKCKRDGQEEDRRSDGVTDEEEQRTEAEAETTGLINRSS